MTELKNALKSRENRTEIINIEKLNFEDEIFFGENGEYLKEKTYQVALISTKGVLALGKIFKEVFDNLGNQNNGTYEKWIKINGFNKRTALRYRKKFELYNLVDPSKKEDIVLYSFDLIEKIFSSNLDENIAFINLGIEKEDLIEKLKNIDIYENKKEEIENNQFEGLFNYEEKISILNKLKDNKNIKPKNLKKINELFKKIELLLEK